jgi:hypothetical protein
MPRVSSPDPECQWGRRPQIPPPPWSLGQTVPPDAVGEEGTHKQPGDGGVQVYLYGRIKDWRPRGPRMPRGSAQSLWRPPATSAERAREGGIKGAGLEDQAPPGRSPLSPWAQSRG